MPFNGSGLFTQPYNWSNDKTNGVLITASRFQTQDSGVAAGLSNAICKDGQQVCTAQIPFAMGLSASIGSAAAPSIVFLGDLTTGWYQSTTGEIDGSISGTRRFSLTSTGINNTAIGVTTPAAGAFTTLNASGAVTFGSLTSLTFAGATSGTTIVQPTAIASGTLTLPAATDTLVGKATSDTLTNKTYDTAGTGNVFKINGTAISVVTGTGAAVLATSPTLVTPALGTPSSGNLVNTSGYVNTTLTNSLSGDVSITSTATYFDGPTVAQGTTGKFFASATLTFSTGSSAENYSIKLWDGTTVIASCVVNAVATAITCASISGIITNPAANIKVSVSVVNQTTNKIVFNASGNSKDSTLTVARLN